MVSPLLNAARTSCLLLFATLTTLSFSNGVLSWSPPFKQAADNSPRRKFLCSVLITCVGTSIFAHTASSREVEDEVLASNLCRPKSKKQKSQIENTRSQIDMAVQASSVQAWSSAAEIVNDPLLDASSLATLFEACQPTAQSSGGGLQQREIYQAIESMREKLRGGGKVLTTGDAMDVMRYGTTARFTFDSFFEL